MKYYILLTFLLSAASRKGRFTFNLPNLIKIDLSGNKLKSDLNIYNTFAPCQLLKHINLNSNLIERLLVWHEHSPDSVGVISAEIAAQEASSPDIDARLSKTSQSKFIHDDDIKSLRRAKYRLNYLESVDLSNNRIKFKIRGEFLMILCQFYQLAPNLQAFFYNQKNGLKLGLKPSDSTAAAESTIVTESSKINLSESNLGEEYLFELDLEDISKEENAGDRTGVLSSISRASSAHMVTINWAYERLRTQLKVIDLSSNNLSKLPHFLFDLNSLTEIYFNENMLKKIPNEFYQRPRITPDDETNFQRLKHLQILQERERAKRERQEMNLDNEEEVRFHFILALKIFLLLLNPTF